MNTSLSLSSHQLVRMVVLVLVKLISTLLTLRCTLCVWWWSRVPLRFICSEHLLVDSWLRSLLSVHTSLPECTLWSCVTLSVTPPSLTRHGQQTGAFIGHLTFSPCSFASSVQALFLLPLSFWLMPAFLLKKIVLGNFAKGPVDPKMADAIDFMVDRVSGPACVSECYWGASS